jgi:hypothetical protein
MQTKHCSLCSYSDAFPYIFDWEQGCPICGAEKGLIEDIEAEEEEDG